MFLFKGNYLYNFEDGKKSVMLYQYERITMQLSCKKGTDIVQLGSLRLIFGLACLIPLFWSMGYSFDWKEAHKNQ